MECYSREYFFLKSNKGDRAVVQMSEFAASLRSMKKFG